MMEKIIKKILTEEWTKKYKKSIDCSNPKGFSQRAHCDARKKRQSGGKTKSKSPFNEGIESLTDSDKLFLNVLSMLYRSYLNSIEDEEFKSKVEKNNVAGFTAFWNTFKERILKNFKVRVKDFDSNKFNSMDSKTILSFYENTSTPFLIIKGESNSNTKWSGNILDLLK